MKPLAAGDPRGQLCCLGEDTFAAWERAEDRAALFVREEEGELRTVT